MPALLMLGMSWVSAGVSLKESCFVSSRNLLDFRLLLCIVLHSSPVKEIPLPSESQVTLGTSVKFGVRWEAWKFEMNKIPQCPRERDKMLYVQVSRSSLLTRHSRCLGGLGHRQAKVPIHYLETGRSHSTFPRKTCNAHKSSHATGAGMY